MRDCFGKAGTLRRLVVKNCGGRWGGDGEGRIVSPIFNMIIK